MVARTGYDISILLTVSLIRAVVITIRNQSAPVNVVDSAAAVSAGFVPVNFSAIGTLTCYGDGAALTSFFHDLVRDSSLLGELPQRRPHIVNCTAANGSEYPTGDCFIVARNNGHRVIAFKEHFIKHR